jgi:hypothetical protein
LCRARWGEKGEMVSRRHVILLLLIVISLLAPNYIGQTGPTGRW